MAGLPAAHGAYFDCKACHLDPTPGSAAEDYADYYASMARHHAVTKSYPGAMSSDYKQPSATQLDIAFFDTNRNGIADPEEIQLFGVDRKVECSSCHREHGETPPPTEPNMYLRVRGEALCTVCHNR